MTNDDQVRSYNALFLCTGNSARSILAEALLGRLGRGRFNPFSAGSTPKGQVNPHALAVLSGLGYEVTPFRSKPWDEFDRTANPTAPELDFVFTVCDNAAGEVCPIWPGQPMTAHWGLPDPAEVTGTNAEITQAFAESYRLLSIRISQFVALPFEKLDRLSLQRRMDSIGNTAS